MESAPQVISGELWFGRHTGDGDILVLDPQRSNSASSNITFFSLTELRTRCFPPSVVSDRIQEISDPEQRALAEGRYREAALLAEQRERERKDAALEAHERLKERILEMHRAYLENRGLTYQGVQESSLRVTGVGARRRTASCHQCGIRLDDFVQARCKGCYAVLCSCGACGCRPREDA